MTEDPIIDSLKDWEIERFIKSVTNAQEHQQLEDMNDK